MRCGPRGPAFASINFYQCTFGRGQSLTVAQSPRAATFCVQSQRVQAYVQSSRGSDLKVLTIHILYFVHLEHVANAVTYDNKHT